MRRHKLAGAAVLLCVLSFGYAAAQDGLQGESAVITFLSGNVDVDRTPDNEQDDFTVAELDMELPRGAIVRTGRDAYCELTLRDGSLLKIAPTSVFKIDDLLFDQETDRKRALFNLLFGRVKATFSKLTTEDSDFEIRSGTALAGVRGTTFGVFYDGVQSQVLVFEGSISLESITNVFEPITVRQGRYTTVLSDGLPESVSKIPKELWQEWDEQFKVFQVEAKVAGVDIAAVEAAEAEAAEAASAPSAPAGEASAKKEEEEEEEKEKQLTFSASVGSVTQEGSFNYRLAFSSEYSRGLFGFGILLPVICQPEDGFFSVDTWENYEEWNFTDWRDAVHDLLLKISYLKYGEEGSPLYVRLGGIERLTLNHHFIVDDYTNMLAFPLRMSSGLTLTSDLNYVGVEAFFARADHGLQTSAVRGYVRPLSRNFPLVIGGSLFYDRPLPDSSLWPVGPSNEKTGNLDQLPHIIIVGFDFGVPLTRGDNFSLLLYGDFGKVGYRYNELHPALADKVAAGKIQFLEGLGTAFGLSGTVVSIVDYRLEYRFIRDYFEPGLVNYNWDNRRLSYPQELLNLILAQKDPGYADAENAGFHLSGSVKLLEKRLSLGLGYGMYKRYDGMSSQTVDRGGFFVRLEEGPIPNTRADFIYERFDDFGGLFRDFIDENTLLETNLYYRIAPPITLSINYRRSYILKDIGRYEPLDAFGINTAVSF
jgi:hypothetical protein